MAGYYPSFMYRPMVPPPKASSRTMQQPVMPGAQAPAVSAIPQAGGGVVNVRQPNSIDPMMVMAPTAPTAPENPFVVLTPDKVPGHQERQQRQQWEAIGRSKQYGDFTGGGTSMYGGGRVIGPPGGMSLTPQDQQAVAQDRMYGAAAGSGPYDSPSAATRFNSLQPQAPHTENMPPVGRTYDGGSRVVRMPDGRTVLVGPGVIKDAERGLQGTMSPEKQDEVLAQEYERTPAGRAAMRGNAYRDTDNGPISGYVPGQLEKRDAHVQKQRDKKAMLQERRQNRAIDKYDLPLSKTYNAPGNVNPNTAATSNGSGTKSLSPNSSVADKQASLTQSVSHPIFAGADKSGFAPETANIQQSLKFYTSKRKVWNDSDKAAFRKYLDDRAANDPDGFGKQLEGWKGTSKYVVGGISDVPKEEIDAANEIRKLYGLPPLVPERQPDPGLPIGG